MLRVVLMSLMALGCRTSDEPQASGPPLVELPSPDLRGISGLARVPGAKGRFLAVAERIRHIVPIAVDISGAVTLDAPIPLLGVPDGLDTESIAFVRPESDPSYIAFGTEAHAPRRSDPLLLGELTPEGARIRKRVELEYEAWSLSGEVNQGIEGLCGVEGRLVMVVERVLETRRGRSAPVAVLDVESEQWRRYAVPLSTPTGKLSSLTCALAPRGELEVTAIERHFGVLRLVRFRLADDDTPSMETLADLASVFPKAPPNFEGLERLGPDRFVLVSDNDYGGVRGPTQLMHWRVP